MSAALLDRRMLAAIRPLDPLGRVVAGIDAYAEGAQFLTKDDGVIVLTRWADLPDFDTSFAEQPANPAIGSLSLPVTLVPRNKNLRPRIVTLALPRDPDPANATDPASLFRAVSTTIPAATSYKLPGQSCALSVSVLRDTDDAPVAGAVLRLTAADASSGPALAITDRHGEALLVVNGIPLARVGAGAQLEEEHEATLDLFVDPATIRVDGSEAPVRDPDAAAGGAAVSSTPVALQARMMTRSVLRWSPP